MEVSNDENNADDLDNIVCISGDECRVCLKKCFDACHLFENDKEISRKLMTFAAVQVDEEDGLPTIICSSCNQLLEISYKFKCQVEKADTKLREVLSYNSNTHNGNKDDASIKTFIADISTKCEQDSSDCSDHETNMCEDFLIDEHTEDIKANLQQLERYDQESQAHIAKNEIFTDVYNNMQNSDQYIEKKIKMEVESSAQTEAHLSNANIAGGLEEVIVSGQNMKQNERKSISSDTIITSEKELVNIDTNNHIQKDNTELNCSNEEEALRRTTSCNENVNSTRTSKCSTKLTDHQNKTTSEKNMKLRYVCYICDKQFFSVEKLKHHILGKHNSLGTNNVNNKDSKNEKPRRPGLREGICKKNDDNLNILRTRRRNRELSCKVCSKKFAYRKSFLSHTKSHPEYKSDTSSNDSHGSSVYMNKGQTNVNTSRKDKFRDDDEDDDEEDDGGDDEDDGDLLTKNLQCKQCGKLFATKRNLKRHISTHSGIKYECSTCGKEFSRIDKLKDHEQSKHKAGIFGQYEEEENKYNDDEDMLQCDIENRKKDKQNRPHKCNLCPKAFAHPQSLANHAERHKRVKDTQKRFLCEVCSKCFAQSGSLIAHMRTHTGVKPYVCNVCSRAFTKSTYLQLHLRTHSGEKPYICQYCSRAFARANTLARHITMHTGEAKYHCQICTKSFRRLTSLNEHTYTHTGQRPYACKICTKRYNNAGSLYAHTKKCKAQRLAGATALTSSADNVAEQTNSSMSQILIYSQRKLAENTTVSQITPTPPYMTANVHNQKALPSNIIQPFTPDDQNLYTVNTKQLRSPYYAIYPSM